MTGDADRRRAVEDGEGLGPLIDRARGAGDGRVQGDVLCRVLNVAEALAAAVAVAAALMSGTDWCR